MSREAILKIQEAEREAERIVSDARTAAAKLLENAETEGRVLCRKTEAKTAEEIAAMLFQLREKSDGMSVRSEKESAEEVAQLSRIVALRRKLAEKIITEGIEAKCRSVQ